MADISYEDMRSCIQEWFAQAVNAIDVAKTYYEVRSEAEAQLHFMLDAMEADTQ